MSEGIILDAEDIKKILAEKFGVDEKDIIKIDHDNGLSDMRHMSNCTANSRNKHHTGD